MYPHVLPRGISFLQQMCSELQWACEEVRARCAGMWQESTQVVRTASAKALRWEINGCGSQMG